MLPESGILLAALVGAGLGASILLLIAGVRGITVDPTRPAGRLARAGAAVRSPAMSGRIGVAVLVMAATLVLTRWPVMAAAIGALVMAWPSLFGGTWSEQAKINQLEALVIWTESLRDTIASHSSLEQAIPASIENAPPLIFPALQRLAGQIQVKMPLDRALLGLSVSLNDGSADRVIAALILNTRRRGDQLAQVLTGLSATARKGLDMRREVLAGRAVLRRGNLIMVLLTVVFVIYLSVFNRDYVAPYSSLTGQVALIAVISMFATGFAWMRRLSVGHDIPPFLPRPGVDMSATDIQVISGLSGAEARTFGNTSGVDAR